MAFNGTEEGEKDRDLLPIKYGSDGQILINPPYFKQLNSLMEDLSVHGMYAEIIVFNFYESTILWGFCLPLHDLTFL